jgi:hypothetical protein
VYVEAGIPLSTCWNAGSGGSGVRNQVASRRGREVHGRRVDDEHVLEQHPHPLREGMLEVRPPQQLLDLAGARASILPVPSADRPFLRFHLVLAPLDGEADQVEASEGRFRQGAQGPEVDRALALLGPRLAGDDVDRDRVVECPAFRFWRLRFLRLTRSEPGVLSSPDRSPEGRADTGNDAGRYRACRSTCAASHRRRKLGAPLDSV